MSDPIRAATRQPAAARTSSVSNVKATPTASAARPASTDEMSTGQGSALRARAAKQMPQATNLQHVSDASARKALEALDRQHGQISGEDFRHAIVSGTSDQDHHGTTSEYRAFLTWAQQNQGRLTPEARKVMAIYTRYVDAARAAGDKGLPTDDARRMRAEMQKAAAPHQHHQTRHQRYLDAIAHPNQSFKRQGLSAKYNPRPDKGGQLNLYNSNCGPTSLAMAVKAFGLEPDKFAKRPKTGIEDSIDLARNAMTMSKEDWRKHPYREGTGDDDITYLDDRMRGARRLGLEPTDLDLNAKHPLRVLDAAFKKDQMVLLGGIPGGGYSKVLRKHDAGYDLTTGHAILVMGKDRDGLYLVADPLSRTGVIHMNGKDLADFAQTSAIGLEPKKH